MTFEENLINLVRDNEMLFNLKSRHYRNANKKEEIWKNIAEKLKVPISDCKQRWKSLRDRFRKECSYKEMPSGSGHRDREEWKYFQNLIFLKDTMKPRKTSGNYNTEEDMNDQSLSSETFVLSPPLFIPPSPVMPMPSSPATPTGEIISRQAPQANSSVGQIMSPQTPSSPGSRSKKRKPGRISNADSIEKSFAGFLCEIKKIAKTEECPPPVQRFSDNELFMRLASAKLDMLPENVKNETQLEILKIISDKIQIYSDLH